MLHCSNLLSLLGAAIVILSCSLHCCQAHSIHPMSKGLCRSLDVGHELLYPVADESVVVQLTNASGAATCYEEGGIYDLTITAHKPIYGLIVVQDPDKIYGTFPYINKRHHTTLPSGLARGFCENTPVEGQNLHNVFENIPSVTHKCNYEYSHQYLSKCNLTSTVRIPFKAPSSKENIVEFRYSIVFRRREFLEDRKTTFMPCSSTITTTTPAPTEATTPAPTAQPTTESYHPVCDVTGLIVEDSTLKAPTICQPSYKSNMTKEIRTITENNMNYTCELEHRLKTCTASCEKDDRLLCCRVKVNKIIQRLFNCTPNDPSASIIRRKFNVTSQKRCECFFCKDLCPAPPTEKSSTENMEEGDSNKNSVELEYSMEELEGGDDMDKDNSVELNDEATTALPNVTPME